jgi:hypothetical protein
MAVPFLTAEQGGRADCVANDAVAAAAVSLCNLIQDAHDRRFAEVHVGIM